MKDKICVEKYLAEKDRRQQLMLMKDYMLSLSAGELTEFVLEPVRFFSKELEKEQLTSKQRKLVLNELEDMVALLQMRVTV